jgi:hypothetical protein
MCLLGSGPGLMRMQTKEGEGRMPWAEYTEVGHRIGVSALLFTSFHYSDGLVQLLMAIGTCPIGFA